MADKGGGKDKRAAGIWGSRGFVNLSSFNTRQLHLTLPLLHDVTYSRRLLSHLPKV